LLGQLIAHGQQPVPVGHEFRTQRLDAGAVDARSPEVAVGLLAVGPTIRHDLGQDRLTLGHLHRTLHLCQRGLQLVGRCVEFLLITGAAERLVG